MLQKGLLGLGMSIVIWSAFFYAPPAMGLGNLARIIFFHVPVAWVGVLAYLVSMVNAVRYLRTRNIYFDRMAAFNAEIGLVFTLLATVTGAVFAQAAWGVFWNWDPRQTSIFVLFLIYGAFFALRSALEEEEQRARLSSVYLILAFFSVPFLVFVVPRIYESLHPDPIINVEGGLNMDAKMFQVFLAALTAFTGLYAWIYQLQKRLIAWQIKVGGDKLE